MKKLLLISLLFLFVSFWSCTYHSKEKEFTDLHPQKPELHIGGSVESDTIFVIDREFIVYLNAGKGHSYQIKIFFNDSLRLSAISISNYFTFRMDSTYPSGIFPVHMQIKVSTENGSLADKRNEDYFVYEKDMIMINGPQLTYQLNYSVSNGTLLCNSTIPSINAEVAKIHVVKTSDNLNTVLADLYGPPFQFEDNQYVGEAAKYVLNYYHTASATVAYRTESFVKQKEISSPQVTPDANGFPVISWQKTPYTNNCASYTVINNGLHYQTDTVAVITDLSQNSFSLQNIFYPFTNTVKVQYTPKNPPAGYNPQTDAEMYSGILLYSPGTPSFPFSTLSTPKGNDVYALSSYGRYLKRYSLPSFSETDDLSTAYRYLNLAVSPNNKYLLAQQEYAGGSFLFYDISSKTKTYVSLSLVTGGITTCNISVADNGIAVISDINNHLTLFDFVHQVKMTSISMPYGTPVISAQGSFIILKSYQQITLFDNRTTLLYVPWQATISGPCTFYAAMDPDDETKLLMMMDQTCSIKKLPEMIPISSFNTVSTDVLNADFFNHRLLVLNNNEFDIYDLNSGNILKQMRMGTTTRPDMVLRGNTLFYGNTTTGSRLTIF